jgi:hypothetical protein
MADPLVLIKAIDALIQLVDAPSRRLSFKASLIGPKGIKRLAELDEIIGSECQQLGISIPRFDQRLREHTILFGCTGLPCTPGIRGTTRPEPSRNWKQSLAIVRRIASELAATAASTKDSNDAVSDQSEKSKKKRRRTMNRAAADCARRFKAERRRDPTISMKQVIKEYVAEQGGSLDTIMRILNDNPDQWKTPR